VKRRDYSKKRLAFRCLVEVSGFKGTGVNPLIAFIRMKVKLESKITEEKCLWGFPV